MTKEEHIKYWLSSAEKDEDIMNYIFNGKRYVQALFFGHLFLEKICKAIWIKNHEENVPPKTHNLLKLLEGSNVGLDKDSQSFLIILNKYQIESRYPEDINSLYKDTDFQIATLYINKIKHIEECLRKNLQ
jgi:HEPN domain-containing protein